MQLVAYGAQDVYLSANPQITFFKVVYRRHTNFAMESIEQGFNGAADFGRKVTATISRNGDLIHRTYLRAELPPVTVQPGYSFRWLNWVGHILIKSVEIEIGGQRIDKHYGDWLHIWNELTQTAGHQIGYANMVGNTPNLTSIWTNTGSSPLTVPGQILYIPLEFWWNRNPGLALPLIALQYHEVKINLELNPANYCFWSGKLATGSVTPSGTSYTTDLSTTAVTVPSLYSCSLFVDYIYLDTDERRRFAQAAHEYLIEQLQFTGDESTSQVSNKVKLSFNHPTKELIWIVQPNDMTTDGTTAPGTGAPFGKQWFNYTDDFDQSYSPSFIYNTAGGTVDLNPGSLAASGASAGGPDVVTMQGSYINNDTGYTQGAGGVPGIAAGGANGVYIPTNFGNGQNPVAQALLQLNGHDRFSIRDGRYFSLVQPYQHHENVPTQGINVYSFALKPEEHQPSGTCNFSRIDTATLNLTLTQNTVIGGLAGANAQRSAIIRVYAVNYNVLRIMSGMGGLAYSD